MSENENTALGKGDAVGNAEGRTDQGTPIALTDLQGRTLAVFLTGPNLGRTGSTLAKGIQNRIDDFLALSCSPLLVCGESIETLSNYRDMENLPFLLISDSQMHVHEMLAGCIRDDASGAWIVDETGVIHAVISPMPPREQISTVLMALSRISGPFQEA